MNFVKTALQTMRFKRWIDGCYFTYIVLPSEQDHSIGNCTIEDFISVTQNDCFGGGIIATTQKKYFLITKRNSTDIEFIEISLEKYLKTLDFITQPVL